MNSPRRSSSHKATTPRQLPRGFRHDAAMTPSPGARASEGTPTSRRGRRRSSPVREPAAPADAVARSSDSDLALPGVAAPGWEVSAAAQSAAERVELLAAWPDF